MRLKQCLFTCLVLFAFGLLVVNPAHGRAEFDYYGQNDGGAKKPTAAQLAPNQQFGLHNIGKIALTITNFGTIGTGYLSTTVVDGDVLLACEYPAESDIEYLFAGAFWIGAVIGRDTLVSVGGDGWNGVRELFPDAGEAGAIIIRSNLPSRPDYDEDAVSEQDFLCAFADTNLTEAGVDPNDNRPHIPINISIQQNSYAWSYDYAEDFVLLDYKITNIGIFPIKSLYMGLYVDADVFHQSNQANGPYDDICGFQRTVDMPAGYGFEKDTVNIAWIADNDGDPSGGTYTFSSPTGVTGVRVVRTPNEDLKYRFNWWISNGTASLDFGPRKAGTEDDPFRPFGTHLGTPTGDRNKYYVLSHEEFDYDQLLSALSHTGEGWLQPPEPSRAEDFANGYDTRYLLSFGPFDVDPGDTLPITLAYVAGEDFHTDPTAFGSFDAFNPYAYYEKLSFKDFGDNARWAGWVFDNPGYDTPTEDHPQGDGNLGHFNWACPDGDTMAYFPETEDPPGDLIADCQKIYYTGDGIPDFRGAAPPPPPKIEVIPGFGKATIRWNGQLTENAIDAFSSQKDFEGYRVYYAQGNRISDYVLLASYDLDDYKIFRYNTVLLSWEQYGYPVTIDSLRSMYGSGFNPLQYNDPTNSFTDPDNGNQLYFAVQDWNVSDITDPHGIHKVYPDALKADSSDTTDEGYLRYYEYEYTIENLEPSIPYNFSVTAFDFGSLKSDLGALESSPQVNAVNEYPLTSAEIVEEQGLEVMVYPNPYRVDGGYAEVGYENRDRTKSSERSRSIHFANLPKVCTIRIFSIDGDLIKQLDHNYPEGGPGSQHEEWDVISRNTQAVVTGIYLWHVESDMGEQIGKLVIMK